MLYNKAGPITSFLPVTNGSNAQTRTLATDARIVVEDKYGNSCPLSEGCFKIDIVVQEPEDIEKPQVVFENSDVPGHFDCILKIEDGAQEIIASLFVVEQTGRGRGKFGSKIYYVADGMQIISQSGIIPFQFDDKSAQERLMLEQRLHEQRQFLAQKIEKIKMQSLVNEEKLNDKLNYLNETKEQLKKYKSDSQHIDELIKRRNKDKKFDAEQQKQIQQFKDSRNLLLGVTENTKKFFSETRKALKKLTPKGAFVGEIALCENPEIGRCMASLLEPNVVIVATSDDLDSVESKVNRKIPSNAILNDIPDYRKNFELPEKPLDQRYAFVDFAMNLLLIDEDYSHLKASYFKPRLWDTMVFKNLDGMKLYFREICRPSPSTPTSPSPTRSPTTSAHLSYHLPTMISLDGFEINGIGQITKKNFGDSLVLKHLKMAHTWNKFSEDFKKDLAAFNKTISGIEQEKTQFENKKQELEREEEKLEDFMRKNNGQQIVPEVDEMMAVERQQARDDDMDVDVVDAEEVDIDDDVDDENHEAMSGEAEERHTENHSLLDLEEEEPAFEPSSSTSSTSTTTLTLKQRPKKRKLDDSTSEKGAKKRKLGKKTARISDTEDETL